MALIEFFKQNIVCDICLVLGVMLLVMTYILAPKASKKSGRYVSGIPCFGGILIALGFLTTPYKWLALLGLLDINIPYLLFIVIPGAVIGSIRVRCAPCPPEIDGHKVIEYTSFCSEYDQIRESLGGSAGAYRTLYVVRYAICSSEDGYYLLALDYKFDILSSVKCSSIKGCKLHAPVKTKNRWHAADLNQVKES